MVTGEIIIPVIINVPDVCLLMMNAFSVTLYLQIIVATLVVTRMFPLTPAVHFF